MRDKRSSSVKCGMFLALGVTLSLVVGANPVEAQTAEGPCSGLTGAEFGLCNAYCEAMDCDSDSPKAAATACEKVMNKFEEVTGGGVCRAWEFP